MDNGLQVMVDLETWGTNDNALIWSIGAVKFLFDKPGRVEDSFHVVIDLGFCEKFIQPFGFKMDVGTLLFWMAEKNDAARHAIMKEKGVDVVEALWAFKDWFGPKSLPTWGNGATFDLVILKNAFRIVVGETMPWSYKDERCFRTLKALAPGDAWKRYADVKRTGTLHGALDDAITQAHQAQALMGSGQLSLDI
jgi:hypothetical protein